ELLTGDVRAAERTLPDWQQPDAAAWPLPVRLAAGLLDALIAERGGDRRRAGQSLEWVLQRAEPDGYRRVFTHAQPPVRELLTAHLDSGTACWPLVNDLVHRLRPPKEPGRPERSAPVMAEPLTER